MLSNPGMGPNAAIMRWIDYILMYQFTLRYIPGKTFMVDRLSQQDPQPDDDEYRLNKDWIDKPDGPLKFEHSDSENNVPNMKDSILLEFDKFKNEIDTCGGYLMIVNHVKLFMNNVVNDQLHTENDTDYINSADMDVDWKCFGNVAESKEDVYLIHKPFDVARSCYEIE